MLQEYNHGTMRRLIEREFQAPVIFFGNRKVTSVGDAEFNFVQESNFLWFTGINHPGVFYLYDGREHLLAVPEKSNTERIFEGESTYELNGTGGLIDKMITYEEGLERIKSLAEDFLKVHTVKFPLLTGSSSKTLPNPIGWITSQLLDGQFSEVVDISKTLSKYRAIKTKREVEALKSAIHLTLESFGKAQKAIQNYQTEYKLEAEFTYSFRKANAHHAYEPIVASGENALTLHYNRNSDELPKNGLVLIDIGARVDGYCADITRTYAIGTPSPREIAVHAAVQKAHYAIIDLIKPGVSLSEYQAKSDEIMKQALRGLDLLKKPEDYRKYFPHAISHGLGIDVHESLGGYKEFMPGMVLTVEPGIYIPEEGIGVRIEDDILVTETGYENLSAALSTDL